MSDPEVIKQADLTPEVSWFQERVAADSATLTEIASILGCEREDVVKVLRERMGELDQLIAASSVFATAGLRSRTPPNTRSQPIYTRRDKAT